MLINPYGLQSGIQPVLPTDITFDPNGGLAQWGTAFQLAHFLEVPLRTIETGLPQTQTRNPVPIQVGRRFSLRSYLDGLLAFPRLAIRTGKQHDAPAVRLDTAEIARPSTLEVARDGGAEGAAPARPRGVSFL